EAQLGRLLPSTAGGRVVAEAPTKAVAEAGGDIQMAQDRATTKARERELLAKGAEAIRRQVLGGPDPRGGKGGAEGSGGYDLRRPGRIAPPGMAVGGKKKSAQSAGGHPGPVLADGAKQGKREEATLRWYTHQHRSGVVAETLLWQPLVEIRNGTARLEFDF